MVFILVVTVTILTEHERFTSSFIFSSILLLWIHGNCANLFAEDASRSEKKVYGRRLCSVKLLLRSAGVAVHHSVIKATVCWSLSFVEFEVPSWDLKPISVRLGDSPLPR